MNTLPVFARFHVPTARVTTFGESESNWLFIKLGHPRLERSLHHPPFPRFFWHFYLPQKDLYFVVVCFSGDNPCPTLIGVWLIGSGWVWPTRRVLKRPKTDIELFVAKAIEGADIVIVDQHLGQPREWLPLRKANMNVSQLQYLWNEELLLLLCFMQDLYLNQVHQVRD